jgi:hypothetical protein
MLGRNWEWVSDGSLEALVVVAGDQRDTSERDVGRSGVQS